MNLKLEVILFLTLVFKEIIDNFLRLVSFENIDFEAHSFKLYGYYINRLLLLSKRKENLRVILELKSVFVNILWLRLRLIDQSVSIINTCHARKRLVVSILMLSSLIWWGSRLVRQMTLIKIALWNLWLIYVIAFIEVCIIGPVANNIATILEAMLFIWNISPTWIWSTPSAVRNLSTLLRWYAMSWSLLTTSKSPIVISCIAWATSILRIRLLILVRLKCELLQTFLIFNLLCSLIFLQQVLSFVILIEFHYSLLAVCPLWFIVFVITIRTQPTLYSIFFARAFPLSLIRRMSKNFCDLWQLGLERAFLNIRVFFLRGQILFFVLNYLTPLNQ